MIGWILLGGISAYVSARFSLGSIGIQIGGVLVLLMVARWLLRPLIDRLLATMPVKQGRLPPNLMAAVFCIVFLMAVCTYQLSIFAIFGGFLAGLLFHRHKVFVEAWREQVGSFVMVFFLPVFFTYTGLRTNILGLHTAADWGWAAVVVGAAVLGKMVPVYFASRLFGFDQRESSILGSLMNTRGLMELIVLNIGFDLGFIPRNMFTVLVIVAIVTTMMTGPLLRVLLPRAGYVIPVGVEA